jgi:hypothetical protein
MTPFEHFAKFYGSGCWYLLGLYASCHHVYCSPTAIALAKQEGDTWWIEYAAGNVEELICHIPFWLPYIGFHVKGSYKCYATARLVNRFLKNDPIKDGPTDPVPRRGRRGSDAKEDTATSAIHRSGERREEQDSGTPAAGAWVWVNHDCVPAT